MQVQCLRNVFNLLLSEMEQKIFLNSSAEQNKKAVNTFCGTKKDIVSFQNSRNCNRQLQEETLLQAMKDKRLKRMGSVKIGLFSVGQADQANQLIQCNLKRPKQIFLDIFFSYSTNTCFGFVTIIGLRNYLIFYGCSGESS